MSAAQIDCLCKTLLGNSLQFPVIGDRQAELLVLIVLCSVMIFPPADDYSTNDNVNVVFILAQP